MDKLYDVTGTELEISGDANHDAMIVETKNLLSLGLNRVTKLESMHNEFELPTLKLYGDMSTMTKDTAVNMAAEYSDGVRSFKCIAKTKWQGQNSLNFPKKNFNIKFIDENKNKFVTSFKDWYPTNGYHIKANYSEYSMVRNCVGVQLGRKIYPNLYPNDARGVVDSFPIVLYINNEFWGCYTWNLSQNADLFAMDETNENHMVFRPDNTGWDVANFEDRVRDETTQYQLAKLSRMVNWTKTCTEAEFSANVEDYFDLDSLRYYWLFMDIGCAGDSMSNNVTCATWDGDIWYVLWYDLDICFGYDQTKYPADTDLIAMSKTQEYAYKYNPIWDKLYATDYSTLCEIYADLRETFFQDAATIIKYFTDYRDLWGSNNLALESQKWGDKRWKSENIDLCGNWITARLAYCDDKYGYSSQ